MKFEAAKLANSRDDYPRGVIHVSDQARHALEACRSPRVSAHLALGEQGVAGTGRAPQDAPVAEAVGLGLAAVVTQADERVLSGHQHRVGIDGWSHICATSTRASL